MAFGIFDSLDKLYRNGKIINAFYGELISLGLLVEYRIANETVEWFSDENQLTREQFKKVIQISNTRHLTRMLEQGNIYPALTNNCWYFIMYCWQEFSLSYLVTHMRSDRLDQLIRLCRKNELLDDMKRIGIFKEWCLTKEFLGTGRFGRGHCDVIFEREKVIDGMCVYPLWSPANWMPIQDFIEWKKNNPSIEWKENNPFSEWSDMPICNVLKKLYQ